MVLKPIMWSSFPSVGLVSKFWLVVDLKRGTIHNPPLHFGRLYLVLLCLLFMEHVTPQLHPFIRPLLNMLRFHLDGGKGWSEWGQSTLPRFSNRSPTKTTLPASWWKGLVWGQSILPPSSNRSLTKTSLKIPVG